MSFFKLLNKTPGTKKTHRTVIFRGNKPLYEQILKLLYIDLKKKAKPLFVARDPGLNINYLSEHPVMVIFIAGCWSNPEKGSLFKRTVH